MLLSCRDVVITPIAFCWRTTNRRVLTYDYCGHNMTIMTKRRTVANAKSHFTECLREAEQGDRVIITRHGRPVAAVVSLEALWRLEQVAATAPRQGLAALAGGWQGADELAASVDKVCKHRSRPRRLG